MAATGPDLALTTDLPELGLPMVYFDAAKLFPTDRVARQAAIVSTLPALARMVAPEDEQNLPQLSHEGERDRADMHRRVQAKLAELGGETAIEQARALQSRDHGRNDPTSKGPGPQFLVTRRSRRFRTAGGQPVEGWIVGNYSTKMQHLRLAGRILELMIRTNCSHEQALIRATDEPSGHLVTGRTVSHPRQAHSIWQTFKSVAHFETARRLLRGSRSLGEILAASDVIRSWLLDYRTRQKGRPVPLTTESETFRIPAAWVPYLPKAVLEPDRSGHVVARCSWPAATTVSDSQVPAAESEAFMRAVRSTRVWSISLPLAGSGP